MPIDGRDSRSDEPMEGALEPAVPGDERTMPDNESGTVWNRRTFFKSAALGTAAAEPVNSWLPVSMRFGWMVG